MPIHIGTCFRFYMQMLYKVKLLTIDFILEFIWKKNQAFAYRVPIGDYNYLQCIFLKTRPFQCFELSKAPAFDKFNQSNNIVL